MPVGRVKTDMDTLRLADPELTRPKFGESRKRPDQRSNNEHFQIDEGVREEIKQYHGNHMANWFRIQK